MFKVNNKDTRAMPLTSFLCLYCKLWTYFTLCSSVSIASFEHLITGWVTNWLVQALATKAFCHYFSKKNYFSVNLIWALCKYNTNHSFTRNHVDRHCYCLSWSLNNFNGLCISRLGLGKFRYLNLSKNSFFVETWNCDANKNNIQEDPFLYALKMLIIFNGHRW